jgi:hypothetical protein
VLVALPDEVPDDEVPEEVPVDAPPAVLRVEAPPGEACVLCGEQKFQVGNNKLATKTIKNS